jgi:predicted lipid carrier protein YhbT
MSIKKESFLKYTNEELRAIRNNLAEMNINALPRQLQDFIHTENPIVGNLQTRINRCISTLDREIIARFMVGQI